MGFDNWDRGGLDRLEVFHQGPLLDLIAELVQVIDHALAIVDPQAGYSDVHV